MSRKRESDQRRGVKRWKFAFGLNTLSILLLAALLVGLLNYLSFRHYHRADVSQSRLFDLSEKTMSVLDGLPKQVKVVVFFQQTEEIFEDVQRLLLAYSTSSPRVRVQYVDPDRDLARAEILAEEYGLEEMNVVIFSSGDRHVFVRSDEIYAYEKVARQGSARPRSVRFNGEPAFTAAILSVLEDRRPVVCLLQGHGESIANDFEDYSGFSDMVKRLEREQLDVVTLTLGKEPMVPEKCDVLIIPGPKKQISQPELDLLGQYLEKGGRVLLLLDAFQDAGLGPLLEDWGIRIANDVVVDGTRTLTGRELFVNKYGLHPVTRKLNTMSSVFYLPRSVVPLSGGDEKDSTARQTLKVTPLLHSSPHGWAEADLNENPMQFNPQRDLPGPVSIGVAVERQPHPGLEVDLRPTRMVVIGDADFVANKKATGANVDLFLSAVNWLIERDDAVGIAPREITYLQVKLDRHQLWVLFGTAAGLIPAIALAAGLFCYLVRRV